MNLIVDEENIALLEHAGTVRKAHGAADVERMMAEDPADLVLLDLGLLGDDGLTVARHLRERHPRVGLVMFTPGTSVDERIRGIENGADHCLAKPVDRRELRAVLDRIYGRVCPDEHAQAIRIAARAVNKARGTDAWAFDPRHCSVTSPQGRSAPLTSGENRILLALARADGQCVKRTELISALHPDDEDVDRPSSHRSLDVMVSRLRAKLRGLNNGVAPLRAEWRIGYAFTGHLNIVDC